MKSFFDLLQMRSDLFWRALWASGGRRLWEGQGLAEADRQEGGVVPRLPAFQPLSACPLRLLLLMKSE